MISPSKQTADMIRKMSETMMCFCCWRASRTPMRIATRVYAKAKSIHSTP